jgi:hypothetical protein
MALLAIEDRVTHPPQFISEPPRLIEMNDLALPGKVTKTSQVVQPRLSFDEWNEVGKKLKRCEGLLCGGSGIGGPTANMSMASALLKFIGPIAFVGAPRCAMAVIEDAEMPSRMMLLHVENNMAKAPQRLAYRIEMVGMGS